MKIVKALKYFNFKTVVFVLGLLYQKFNTIRLFYAVNQRYWLKSSINVGSNLKVNQKVRLTGSGSVVIGENVTLGFKQGGFIRGAGIEIQPRGKRALISIGNNVSLNNNVFICSQESICIKDNVLLGQNVTIMDFEAHSTSADKRSELGEVSSILIEENVWVGNNVTILKGSSIGKNSIIATHAVVSGEFPENVVIGGVPAKIIKRLT